MSSSFSGSNFRIVLLISCLSLPGKIHPPSLLITVVGIKTSVVDSSTLVVSFVSVVVLASVNVSLEPVVLMFNVVLIEDKLDVVVKVDIVVVDEVVENEVETDELLTDVVVISVFIVVIFSTPNGLYSLETILSVAG